MPNASCKQAHQSQHSRQTTFEQSQNIAANALRWPWLHNASTSAVTAKVGGLPMQLIPSDNPA
jgi:hypothetical protein